MRPVFLNPHKHRIFSAIVVAASIMLGSMLLIIAIMCKMMR